MPLPSYPIAADGHAALAQLRQDDDKRASREREAETLAGHRVAFVTQSIGPLYASEDEARKAYAGVLDETRVCTLTCRLKSAATSKRAQVQPLLENGARWPKAQVARESQWQLSISYWKALPATRIVPGNAPKGQARKLRKDMKSYELTPEQVVALTETPMTAARPQKALDFGLFDFIPPDNPGIVIADE